MKGLENGDLQLDNGAIIPAARRRRCEVYSRVVGYLRPIAQWNKGKKAEWADRKDFVVRKGNIVNIGAESGMNTESVTQASEKGGILPVVT